MTCPHRYISMLNSIWLIEMQFRYPERCPSSHILLYSLASQQSQMFLHDNSFVSEQEPKRGITVKLNILSLWCMCRWGCPEALPMTFQMKRGSNQQAPWNKVEGRSISNLHIVASQFSQWSD